MNLFIATPAFGGLVTTQYVGSLLESTLSLAVRGIGVRLFTLSNESFIQRGRNKCMYAALHDKRADKLLFVDADVGFTPADLNKLLVSGHKIIGGTYPVKEYPVRLNYNLLDGAEDTDAVIKEVKHVPTGFLLIDLKLMRELSTRVPTYSALWEGQEVRMHDFFPSGIRNDVFESEDWGFCSLMRELGQRIYLHTDVILTHTGTHTFRYVRDTAK